MKPQTKTLKPRYEAPVITGFDLSLEADICNPAMFFRPESEMELFLLHFPKYYRRFQY